MVHFAMLEQYTGRHTHLKTHQSASCRRINNSDTTLLWYLMRSNILVAM